MSEIQLHQLQPGDVLEVITSKVLCIKGYDYEDGAYLGAGSITGPAMPHAHILEFGEHVVVLDAYDMPIDRRVHVVMMTGDGTVCFKQIFPGNQDHRLRLAKSGDIDEV